MRHQKSGRRLNRNSSHRKSMFQNMVISLIYYEIIKTSVAKAKELKCIIEPLITFAKINNVANHRLLFARIRNNEIIAKLFNDIAPRFLNRTGGYTRIIRCGFRVGDNAPMSYIELIERKIISKTQVIKK